MLVDSFVFVHFVWFSPLTKKMVCCYIQMRQIDTHFGNRRIQAYMKSLFVRTPFQNLYCLSQLIFRLNDPCLGHTIHGHKNTQQPRNHNLCLRLTKAILQQQHSDSLPLCTQRCGLHSQANQCLPNTLRMRLQKFNALI